MVNGQYGEPQVTVDLSTPHNQMVGVIGDLGRSVDDRGGLLRILLFPFFLLCLSLGLGSCTHDGLHPDVPDASNPVPDAAMIDGGDAADAGETPNCTVNGHFCATGSDCCSRSCAGGVCGVSSCKADGQACAAHAECCSSTCYQGKCIAFCQPDKFGCGRNDDCCNFACNGYQCGPPPQGCTLSGIGPCSQDAECCSKKCDQGVCAEEPRICKPPGARCDQMGFSNCCEGRCIGAICASELQVQTGDRCLSDAHCENGKCIGGVCSFPCGVKGDKCFPGAGGSDGCCGGNCVGPGLLGGTCGEPTACYPLWAQCSKDAQCCTQLCANGLCKDPGPCKADGVACQGGSACCHGLCERGYNGFVQCVSCVAAGCDCTSSAQCCGKLCEGGVCKLAPGPCERTNGAYCNNAAECCSKKCPALMAQCFGDFCSRVPVFSADAQRTFRLPLLDLFRRLHHQPAGDRG